MSKNTIFDLQQSKSDSKFVADNGNLEIEVGIDIIETVADIPYLGSLFKLGKVALNYIDYRFFRKLARFLKYANEIPEEKIASFLEELSPEDKMRISDYLTQLLYTTEEENKAELMGKIYKRRVYGEIDNDMMLRLCSIVCRAYITDLKHLKEYQNISDINTYITDNLVSLGVLADSGNLYYESKDGWENTGFGPTKHILNEVGRTLFNILTDQPIP